MRERDDREDTRDLTETAQRSERGVVDERRDDEGFLPQDRMEEYRERWDDIQAQFVDDPRTSVQKAHGLVSSIVTELNETFARERSGLESQWNRGESADTEALRIALQRYRSFLNRLLR